jgi:endonuclease/exonuclease/phosphatase family metal-dependent hydrolase
METIMLRILTFNAGLLKLKLFGRTLVEPAPYVDERFPYLAPALLSSGADIIALQEVYDRKHQARLADDLKAAYPHHAVSPIRPWRPLGAALMLLSKFPIAETQFIMFKDVPPDERLFVDKGMIVATVDAGSFGPIVISNSHHTSGGMLHHPEGAYTSRARSRQYRQLFDVLDRDASADRFAVGDFNCGPEALPKNYQELLSSGYTDAWAACHNASAPTWDPKNELNAHGPHRLTSAQRMDHILFRAGARRSITVKDVKIIFNDPCVSVSGGRKVTISDHYGLAADLER